MGEKHRYLERKYNILGRGGFVLVVGIKLISLTND